MDGSAQEWPPGQCQAGGPTTSLRHSSFRLAKLFFSSWTWAYFKNSKQLTFSIGTQWWKGQDIVVLYITCEQVENAGHILAEKEIKITTLRAIFPKKK